MEAEVDVLNAFSRLARDGERLCAVCLRGAREARLVVPRALRSFLNAVDSPALRTHMMFVEWVCYVCEAQAATAMRFHCAVASAAAVHRLFNVIKKNACQVDPEMELEARRLNAQMSQQRARTRLKQTEVLLVDSANGCDAPRVAATPTPAATPTSAPTELATAISSILPPWQPGEVETVILDDDDESTRSSSPPPAPSAPPAAPGGLPALVPIDAILEDGVVERCGSVVALVPNEMQMMLRSMNAPDTFVLHPVVRAPPPSSELLVPSLNVRLVDNRLEPLPAATFTAPAVTAPAVTAPAVTAPDVTAPAAATATAANNTHTPRGVPMSVNSVRQNVESAIKNGSRAVTRASTNSVSRNANSPNKSDNTVNKTVNNNVKRNINNGNKSDDNVNMNVNSINIGDDSVIKDFNSVYDKFKAVKKNIKKGNKSDDNVNKNVNNANNNLSRAYNNINRVRKRLNNGDKSDDNVNTQVYSVNKNVNLAHMNSEINSSIINNNNSEMDKSTENIVDNSTDVILERILQEKVSARAKRTTPAPRPPPGVGDVGKRARQEATGGGSYMVDYEMVTRLLREGDEARRGGGAPEGDKGAGDVTKAPLVKAGRIDWEDKIPMDVISFMDATDPQAAQMMAPPRPPEMPRPPETLSPPATPRPSAPLPRTYTPPRPRPRATQVRPPAPEPAGIIIDLC